MKFFLVSIICLFGIVGVEASTQWRPDERLLDALCQIESSGGRFISGDDGRSLGYFQMQKPAWADVVKWRAKQNLPTHDYKTNVFDSRISRLYAADYLTIIHTRLKSQYKREPTAGELYAAYNMGMNGFRKCGYDLKHVNPITRGKCKMMMASVAATTPPSAMIAVISLKTSR